VKGAGFQQRAGHFLMIKRALRELDQCHHSHLKSEPLVLPPLASSRVYFYKFLLVYSKPCLLQHPRPYSFQKSASLQVSVHLAKQFQRRFLEINQPETKIAYGSHVC
jgi:hypothetical protein